MGKASNDSLRERLSFALGHGVDPESRTLYIVGGINEELAFRFTVAFQILDAEPGPIRIVMNSSGGSEPDGFAIYDVLRLAQNEVTIDCVGVVQSIAALILQAGAHRRLSPECRFMFHNGHLEFDGKIYQGAVVAIAQESDYLTKRYRQILADRSRQPLLQVSRWCNKEAYFSASRAVELGFADEIIERNLNNKKMRLAKTGLITEIDTSTVEKIANRKRKT